MELTEQQREVVRQIFADLVKEQREQRQVSEGVVTESGFNRQCYEIWQIG